MGNESVSLLDGALGMYRAYVTKPWNRAFYMDTTNAVFRVSCHGENEARGCFPSNVMCCAIGSGCGHGRYFDFRLACGRRVGLAAVSFDTCRGVGIAIHAVVLFLNFGDYCCVWDILCAH